MIPSRRFLFQQPLPALDLNFTLMAVLPSVVSYSRTSSATDLLYTSTTVVYNTVASNVPRLNGPAATNNPQDIQPLGGAPLGAPDFAVAAGPATTANGLLIEEQRINSFLNSNAPVTQTIALTIGTYTLWMIGSGSMTSAGGTATGSGFGAATQGAPNTFTLTGAGTVTVTKSGTVGFVQLENGPFATSGIVTTGSAVTRAADVATVPTTAFAWGAAAGTVISEFSLNNWKANGRIVGDDIGRGIPAINNSTGNLQFVDSGGSPVTANAMNAGAINKAAASWNATTEYVGLNGGAIASGAIGNGFSTTSALYLGTDGNSDTVGQIWMRHLRYWNRDLHAQIPALTQ